MGDKSKRPQRIVVFDDHEDDLQTRKKKMEESPKGMLDTPPDMTSSAWLRTNSTRTPPLSSPCVRGTVLLCCAATFSRAAFNAFVFSVL